MALKLWVSGGMLVVDGDGKPIICETCTCASCPDVETLTVTISGVSACGCQPEGAGSHEFTVFTGVNAVHTLNNVSPSLAWAVTGVGAWEVTHYSDIGCLTPTSVDSGTFTVSVECTDGVLVVLVSGGTDTPKDAFSGSGVFDVSIANTKVCSETELADGGTALVEL